MPARRPPTSWWMIVAQRCPCRARGLRCPRAPASRSSACRPGSSGRLSPASAHGAERAHAAIGLVGAALVELDLAGRFLGAGEQAADHHAVRAGGDRLGDVAGIADAAIGDQRHAGALAAPRPRWTTAVICGTPTPATMRVVQMEPGPMPTFTASAPAVDQRRARRPRWRCCRR